MEIILDIKNLKKSFIKGVPVLSIESLSIKRGTTVAVVGESGSGKTTLMRLITGLESPESGTITLDGKIFTSDNIMISPEKRKIGMVFQDHALFPHLTIYENLAYGLSNKKIINDRVIELLRLIELEGYQNRYPHELSGGQQQRIALARALAPKPDLLILDEPFTNIDTSLKLQLRNEIFRILKKTNVTTLFITHDIDDAIYISDEIVVLKNGEILQKGDINELYKYPQNIHIASLFSVLEKLNIDQLKIFGFSGEKNKTYAVRQNDFLLNEQTDFMTDGKIITSNYHGSYYLYTIEIYNQCKINFKSKDILKGINKIGFKKDSLIIFKNS